MSLQSTKVVQIEFQKFNLYKTTHAESPQS
jgi:hypothetical protein